MLRCRVCGTSLQEVRRDNIDHPRDGKVVVLHYRCRNFEDCHAGGHRAYRRIDRGDGIGGVLASAGPVFEGDEAHGCGGAADA